MNDKIVKIVITEYLCDHCDSVFLSPLLVQQHQKKSCMGVIKKEEDERDELKKFEYKERHSANPSRCNGCGMIFIEKGIQNIAVKDFNEFKVKEKKDFKCWECNEPNILKMIKDKIRRDSYIQKFQ